MAKLDETRLSKLHWPLIFCVIAIAGLGVYNLASAGRAESVELWKAQLRNLGFGTMLIAFSLFVDYRILRSLAWPLYLAALAMLVLVRLHGRTVMGAQRWLSFGPLNLQPSEFAKIGVILILARHFADYPSEDRVVRKAPPLQALLWWWRTQSGALAARWRGALVPPMPQQRPERPVRIVGYTLVELLIPFALLFIPVVLVVVQPDMGTGLVTVAIGGSLILFAGMTRNTFVSLVTVGGALSAYVLKFKLKPYQQHRIDSFLDPSGDALGKGYHAIQSLIAVGSGQMWGKGWGNGTQNQLQFLPEQHTDFAFPVFAEEHGFVGSAVMVLLFLFLVLCALDIASNARDRFGAYLSFGAAALFFWHAFINIGMVTGVLPVVGVPLLLVSYGGSSAVLTMLTIGVLLNVSLRKTQFS